MLTRTVAELAIKGETMEIDAIYVMGTARKCFRLYELLAQLEESFKVDAIQCAVIRNDYTVDMRVAFSNLAKVKAESAAAIDDEGYGWVRFVNPAWVPGYLSEGWDDGWLISFRGKPVVDWQDVLALQEELLAEIEATE